MKVPHINADSIEQLTNILAGFVSFTAKYLSDDVLEQLKGLQACETSALAQANYTAMLDNVRMAEEQDKPICQDTGLVQFYIQAGTAFPYLSELENCLKDAVIRATVSAPLRPNVIQCFDEENTGNNTGTHIPWIDWELVPGSDKIRLFVYLAGGGCSLPGFAKVFTPLDAYETALNAVFDQLVSLGVNACPPLLVGLGFGGQADAAAKLSKKALFRFIGERNSNPRIAGLEEQLEEALNNIGIGPGGFTGNKSVLAVHIEQAGRHIASLAAALSIGCWVHRRSLIEIQSNLNYQILSHKRLGTIQLHTERQNND